MEMLPDKNVINSAGHNLTLDEKLVDHLLWTHLENQVGFKWEIQVN